MSDLATSEHINNMEEPSSCSTPSTDGGGLSNVQQNGGVPANTPCRDFARGFCDRKNCRYLHDIKPLNFCHDYQNATCMRPLCKFIHCTSEEVDHYKLTGEMSNQIIAEAARKNQMPGIGRVCNAFKLGNCDRLNCKYRHISKSEQDSEIIELIQKSRMNQGHKNDILPTQQGKRPLQMDEDITRKRQYISSIDVTNEDMIRGTFNSYYTGSPPSLIARNMMLEEENSILHKEIAKLKKQVSDLTATNEFLLDQNANLRINNKRNTTVNVPAVTLTNTISQNNQVIRTVAASVATVPVSLATVTTCNPVSGNPVSIAGVPSVSIAPAGQILAPSQQILVTTNQPTQLALTNNSQAQLAIAQQNLANNLAAAQQGQTQQIAIATPTQQQINQQQLALANTTQQLTSQAQQLAMANTPQQLAVASVPQQLALASTSQQILAAAAAQQNSQLELHSQLTGISTSQSIAMSNATQPMVSYPIMTHAMPH